MKRIGQLMNQYAFEAMRIEQTLVRLEYETSTSNNIELLDKLQDRLDICDALNNLYEKLYAHRKRYNY